VTKFRRNPSLQDHRGQVPLVAVPFQVASDRRTQVRLTIGFAMVALNLFDLILTKIVLANGGIETNPLMQGIVGSDAAPWAVKALVPAAATAMLLFTPVHSRRGERLSAAVVGLYSAIVLWNTVLLGYLWLAR
jgi:hypothetical protein